MRLAIVGSTKFADPFAEAIARELINRKLFWFRPAVVISGGAEGVDEMAEQIAWLHGYREGDGAMKPLIIHRPKNRRWQPEGFKERNLRIAEDCTHLLAIRCKRATTYGSGWTADRAEELGKTVWRELL